jgi:diaminopimelate epimerase
MPGGDLVVAWPGGSHSLSMTGSAARVFEGTIQLDA